MEHVYQDTCVRSERAIIRQICEHGDKPMALCHASRLRRHHFTGAREEIFSIIQQMHIAGESLEYITVAHKFTASLKCSTELDACYEEHSLESSLHEYIRIILESTQGRMLERAIAEARSDLREGNVTQAVNLLKLHMNDKSYEDSAEERANPEQVVRNIISRYEHAKQTGSAYHPSRWYPVQQITAGYYKVTIVGGRPKEGKSTAAINECTHTSILKESPEACGIISVEMEAEEVFEKIASDLTGIDPHELKHGESDPVQISSIAGALHRAQKAPIHVIDGVYITSDILNSMRNLRQNHDVKLCVIDYAQLIYPDKTTRGQSRTEELGKISRAITNQAKRLHLPTILVSQLSRKAAAGKPDISHLRDSGALEADAYTIMLIYQDPDYRGATENNVPTILDIAASRGGGSGVVRFLFQKSCNRMVPDPDNYGGR